MPRKPSTRVRRASETVVQNLSANQDATSASPTQQGPGVTYVRSEYSDMLNRWRRISDCLEGQDAIKAKREVYLPIPRVEDDPVAQESRYTNYLERAIYYNVPSRTLNGFMGQVFSRDPIVQVPTNLESVVLDSTGGGISLNQLAKKCLGFVMGHGRAGLLADYPPLDKPVTKLDEQLGLARPTITLYSPTSIINWRTQVIGARLMLTLVVIDENIVSKDDGFGVSYVQQWRVLRLLPTGYQVQIWRRESNEDPYYVFQTYMPTDGNGQPFQEIPFQFVGPMDNGDLPNNAPLLDLCEISIGHYRNSADYEEMAFIAGQPTAWFSGLTDQWVKEVFTGQVYLGSRAIVPLPAGAQAGLLQVQANSVPKEAMAHKEAQMIAMGANLLVPSSGNKTFGEAQLESSNEQSTLSASTKNVSAAVQKVLRWAYQFATGIVNDPSIIFDLNTDFPAARLTPNERAELILEWQQGAITYTEMRAGLRLAGVASEDDAEAEQKGKDYVEWLAKNASAAKVGDAASGGTNKPKLNTGNGGGNQAGN